MARVAIVVSTDYSELVPKLLPFDEAAALCRAFRDRGVETVTCTFGDSTILWTQFDAVIAKCAWDYVVDAPAFLRWLETLDSMGVPLINSSALVRWNHDKSYLVELRAAGISVAPFTLFPARTDLQTILRYLRAGAPKKFAMKPSVSSGGRELFVGTPEVIAEALLAADRILDRSSLIIQPFFDEITAQGEWSLFFVSGQLTHAVLKFPRAGDFRTQGVWGGIAQSRVPSPRLVSAAHGVLDAAPSAPTYARVDGFDLNGDFHLMELEVIEPYFYFEHAGPSAVHQFCAPILDSIVPSQRLCPS